MLLYYIMPAKKQRGGRKLDVKQEVKKIEEEIINRRRDLHKIPELGDEVPLTTKYINDVLSQMGLTVKKYSNSGLSTVIEGKNLGPTIAFRADIDALPIKEETGLPFAAKNGMMHACGHDAHTAMLLGTAKVLSEHRNDLYGNVVLIFQPAEETTGGAETMIKEGCLMSPKADCFFSLHIGSLFHSVGNGCIGVKKGSLMASVSSFNVKIKGVGGHGAHPDKCVDPILISCEIIQSLQKLVSREINPIHGAVVTVGMIHGGNIVNVIPDEVSFGGTVRALTKEDAAHLEKRITQMIPAIASANGGKADVSYKSYYPPTFNDGEMTDFLEACATKIVGPQNVVHITEPSTGTEDVAYYINEVPGSFGMLGSWKAHDDGKFYPHHNSKFHLDESTFWIGSALFVQCALDFCKRVEE